jgi:hypothetical protein
MIWQSALARKAGLSPSDAILTGIAAGLFVLWLAVRSKRPTLLLGI